jgi:hypothetical protein
MSYTRDYKAVLRSAMSMMPGGYHAADAFLEIATEEEISKAIEAYYVAGGFIALLKYLHLNCRTFQAVDSLRIMNGAYEGAFSEESSKTSGEPKTPYRG